MKVRTNAETPADARTAREFGAEGIGLCRTEHMFFDETASRRARDDPGRRRGGPPPALAKLLPMQREDFVECSASWPACRSRSACSIRRCTSSCRTPTKRSRRWRRRWRAIRAKLRQRAARCTNQSDARPSRLPPGVVLSRDLRDAGARHLRGGRARSPRPAPPMPEIMIPLVATKAELDS
jgi:pyruvate,orthophosphate dikinase